MTLSFYILGHHILFIVQFRGLPLQYTFNFDTLSIKASAPGMLAAHRNNIEDAQDNFIGRPGGFQAPNGMNEASIGMQYPEASIVGVLENPNTLLFVVPLAENIGPLLCRRQIPPSEKKLVCEEREGGSCCWQEAIKRTAFSERKTSANDRST